MLFTLCVDCNGCRCLHWSRVVKFTLTICINTMATMIFFLSKISPFFDKEIEKILGKCFYSSVNLTNFGKFLLKFWKKIDIKNMEKETRVEIWCLFKVNNLPPNFLRGINLWFQVGKRFGISRNLLHKNLQKYIWVCWCTIYKSKLTINSTVSYELQQTLCYGMEYGLVRFPGREPNFMGFLE